MKRFALFGFALSLFAAAASASVTTYYWHQTSASLPGLVFTGHYTVADGVTVIANSKQDSPTLMGLSDFYLSGGRVEPVTLGDLTTECFPPVDYCIIGLPDWQLSLTGNKPNLHFIDAKSTYDYTVQPFSLFANTDDPSTMCNTSGLCSATGYWSTDFVPAPATVSVFVAGLLGLFLFGAVRAGSGRTRS